MYKRIVKNSAIYGILPQFPKVASFFILPLITPYLTGVDYGVVAVLGAYIGAISVFHLLGFNVVVTNAFYRHPKQYKWMWRQVYGFLWSWSLVYFCILSVILYFTLPSEAHAHRWEIILMKIIPLLLFGVSDMLASVHYRLKHKALPIASRSLFAGFAAIGLNYYFIAVLKMGYMGWVTSEFITSIISGILFFIPVIRTWKFTPIFNFKWRLIKRCLKISLPVIPHSYGSFLLNSSDRVVMERLNVSTAQIGQYGLAYSFGLYINTVTNAINQAIGPNLIELMKANKWKDYERIIFAFQCFAFFTCFSISLWTPQWLPLLIRNQELQDINYLLVIIIMSYSFKPLYIGCNQVVFYFEKTNILWRITFIAGLINIVSNIIFIPYYGVTAAAVNTFIALMYHALAGFFFNHFKMHNKAKLYPFSWLAIILGGLCILLNSLFLAIIYKVVIEMAVICLILLAFFRHQRVKSIRHIDNV